jgi:hypothetical protein
LKYPRTADQSPVLFAADGDKGRYDCGSSSDAHDQQRGNSIGMIRSDHSLSFLYPLLAFQ